MTSVEYLARLSAILPGLEDTTDLVLGIQFQTRIMTYEAKGCISHVERKYIVDKEIYYNNIAKEPILKAWIWIDVAHADHSWTHRTTGAFKYL